MYRKLLDKGVKEGVIRLQLPGGKHYRFGHGGREATWVVEDEATLMRIARNWEFQLGQTYMEGRWRVEGCDLQDLLSILRTNFSSYRVPPLMKPLATVWQQWNRISNSLSNIKSHYDLDQNLFRLFLDGDMHYSCAYFEQPGIDLETAQQAKCRHIANKLLLKPGHKVLDVGCGWGSLAFYLAKHEQVEVVGITLSREQLDFARWRAQANGVKNVSFELADYRKQHGLYDRIVSVGMFEHVGKPHYQTYYQQLKRLLDPEGVALIHTIGRSGPPGLTNPWIRKYIFPGGAIPALSEMARATEEAQLIQTDLEVMRLHYAYTLRAWFDRFQQHRQEICKQMGETFCLMWEFYLAVCEVCFHCSDLVVYQQQLARSHGVVPITRDYLYHQDTAQWASAGGASVG